MHKFSSVVVEVGGAAGGAAGGCGFVVFYLK